VFNGWRHEESLILAVTKPSHEPDNCECDPLFLSNTLSIDRNKSKAVGRPEHQSTQRSFDFLDDQQPAVSAIRIDTQRKIQRIRPPVKAHGGKYYLARQIVPILLSAPGNPTEYLEPCAFGASVFLAMPRFEREILGDVNPDVVALWQVLSHERYSTVLSDRLSSIPYKQSVFEEAKNETPIGVVERAVRFLIQRRFSRGGLGTALDYASWCLPRNPIVKSDLQ
jgi:hypothetical protein